MRLIEKLIMVLVIFKLIATSSAWQLDMDGSVVGSSKVTALHRTVRCRDACILLKLVYDADRIDERKSFCLKQLPVALFLSGADCPHESYMWLASQLAKAGFCVVLSSCVVPFGPSSSFTCLLSMPYDMSMLGSLSEYKKGPSSEGIAAVLQHVDALGRQEDGPLYGKLDLSRLVIGGHSSGGRTALDLVAFDNPFPISAVFTYGASLVNSGQFGSHALCRGRFRDSK